MSTKRPAGGRRKSAAAPKRPPAAPGRPTATAAPLDAEERRALTRRYGRYVLVAIVLVAVILSILSVQRFRDFYGGRFDTGNMVQAVYNTAHGHFLEITTAEGKQTSRLGSHVDPILAVFALPWLVWPSPEMLLVLQAVIVALAGWPAYRIGLRVLGDPLAALLMTLALLLYPPLQYAVLNEFHPVTLAIPLLLFGFLYLDEGRWLRAVPFLVLAALCKEEIPLVIVLMALYFGLRRHGRPVDPVSDEAVGRGTPYQAAYEGRTYHFSEERHRDEFVREPPKFAHPAAPDERAGRLRRLRRLLPARVPWWPLAIAVVSAGYFVIAVKVILPHYSSGGSPFLSRYSDYGSSAGEIGLNVILRPGTTLGDLFAWSNLKYLFNLLWPFGFTSVLSPLTTLIAAPELLLNALASRIYQRSYEFHYVAGEVPFLFAGAVFGIVRLRGWLSRQVRATRQSTVSAPRVSVAALATIVLVATVGANYRLGPLPFSLPGAHYNGRNYAVSGHARVLSMAIKMIPSGGNVVVSTENIAGSHLSARRVVYTFPYIDSAQWVIVDQKNPFWFDQPDAVRHSQALGALVLNQNYQSVFARDGVYVFKRVANVASPPGGAPPLPFSTPGAAGSPSPTP